MFKTTFRSRELIYPGIFGDVTAGADDYLIAYSQLNIQGYAPGGNGLPEGLEARPCDSYKSEYF